MSFLKAMEFVLKWEGGYVNDPSDRGGETKYGISKRAYPRLDIKNLTKEQAQEIYLNDYWKASGADKLPWPLSLYVFDTAVNMGVKRALDFLKKSNGSVSEYAKLRGAFYTRIAERRPSSMKFMKGWTNRLNDMIKFGGSNGIRELGIANRGSGDFVDSGRSGGFIRSIGRIFSRIFQKGR